MADHDRNTDLLSAQQRTLLEIVNDVLARYGLSQSKPRQPSVSNLKQHIPQLIRVDSTAIRAEAADDPA